MDKLTEYEMQILVEVVRNHKDFLDQKIKAPNYRIAELRKQSLESMLEKILHSDMNPFKQEDGK